MTNNTRKIEEFGFIERQEAGRLLLALGTHHDKTKELNGGIYLEFNPSSGYVFLGDEDGNTAMMNGHDLENHYDCPQCGNYGFHGDDYEFETHEGYCCQECADKNKLHD